MQPAALWYSVHIRWVTSTSISQALRTFLRGNINDTGRTYSSRNVQRPPYLVDLAKTPVLVILDMTAPRTGHKHQHTRICCSKTGRYSTIKKYISRYWFANWLITSPNHVPQLDVSHPIKNCANWKPAVGQLPLAVHGACTEHWGLVAHLLRSGKQRKISWVHLGIVVQCRRWCSS